MKVLGSMMTRFLGVLLVLVLVGCSDYEFDEHIFELNIQDQGILDGSSTLKVKKNDLVSIIVFADASVSLHLHGYDLKQEINPDHPAKFEFKADATGSFPFTIHSSGESAGKENDHDHGKVEELESHGGLFESGTLETGYTFRFRVTDSLKNITIPYHNHMNHQMVGSIEVRESAELLEKAHIEISEDGSFHPANIVVRPGALVIWSNLGDSRARPTSGYPLTGDGQDKISKTGHGHEMDEEIEVARLEVQPR